MSEFITELMTVGQSYPIGVRADYGVLADIRAKTKVYAKFNMNQPVLLSQDEACLLYKHATDNTGLIFVNLIDGVFDDDFYGYKEACVRALSTLHKARMTLMEYVLEAANDQKNLEMFDCYSDGSHWGFTEDDELVKLYRCLSHYHCGEFISSQHRIETYDDGKMTDLERFERYLSKNALEEKPDDDYFLWKIGRCFSGKLSGFDSEYWTSENGGVKKREKIQK